MQVEYLATISLPDDGRDVNTLAETCLEAARNAAKELFLRALKQREEGISQIGKGRERQDKRILNYYVRTNYVSQAKLQHRRMDKNSYFYAPDKPILLELVRNATVGERKNLRASN